VSLLAPSKDLYVNFDTCSYYNSPKLSDVKILLRAKKSPGRGVGQPRIEIFAHKIVLAAGSRAFRNYFETHEEVKRSKDTSVLLTSTWS
jgi:hypothetical protein